VIERALLRAVPAHAGHPHPQIEPTAILENGIEIKSQLNNMLNYEERKKKIKIRLYCKTGFNMDVMWNGVGVFCFFHIVLSAPCS